MYDSKMIMIIDSKLVCLNAKLYENLIVRWYYLRIQCNLFYHFTDLKIEMICILLKNIVLFQSWLWRIKLRETIQFNLLYSNCYIVRLFLYCMFILEAISSSKKKNGNDMEEVHESPILIRGLGYDFKVTVSTDISTAINLWNEWLLWST